MRRRIRLLRAGFEKKKREKMEDEGILMNPLTYFVYDLSPPFVSYKSPPTKQRRHISSTGIPTPGNTL
jgi:hypothetical protein